MTAEQLFTLFLIFVAIAAILVAIIFVLIVVDAIVAYRNAKKITKKKEGKTNGKRTNHRS